MRKMFKAVVAAFMLAGFATAASAQSAPSQMLLTEKHVQAFIAAQKDIGVVVEKMQGPSKPTARYEAELEAATKKHGFKNFAEYEAVAANISLLMAAIDPQTKTFTDPQAAIKKEIDDVKADKTIPEAEKKQLLDELAEALKSAQSIQFPSNIDLVTKYYDKIDAALG
jgi:hypothetical protein